MMTDAQRSIEVAALCRPSGAPAWKMIASWYVVAITDKVIPADGQRFMAQRAGARVTEAAGSQRSNGAQARSGCQTHHESCSQQELVAG